LQDQGWRLYHEVHWDFESRSYSTDQPHSHTFLAKRFGSLVVTVDPTMGPGESHGYVRMWDEFQRIYPEANLAPS
jgi:hypothetical protein